MKLLLDENLPKRLKSAFESHFCYTVSDMGWTGKKNGELLGLLIQHDFDVFITFDKNLQYQQNLAQIKVTIVILNAPDNTFPSLKLIVPEIISFLDSTPGVGIFEIGE